MECEKCKSFERQTDRLYCKRQKTFCDIVKSPDLGRKLSGCKFERKERKKNV